KPRPFQSRLALEDEVQVVARKGEARLPAIHRPVEGQAGFGRAGKAERQRRQAEQRIERSRLVVARGQFGRERHCRQSACKMSGKVARVYVEPEGGAARL